MYEKHQFVRIGKHCVAPVNRIYNIYINNEGEATVYLRRDANAAQGHDIERIDQTELAELLSQLKVR